MELPSPPLQAKRSSISGHSLKVQELNRRSHLPGYAWEIHSGDEAGVTV